MILAASIILVLLATYWFAAKEGFFSGVVHLACVVVAGAIAFAFWEPLAHALLGVGAMREWAWGLGILLPFCVSLLVLRIATNLLIPDRQNYPQVVDLVGGGVTGVGSGIITAGIGLIGIGFLPIGDMGGGFVRTRDSAGQPAEQSGLPFPAAMTEAFYGSLSRGSFAPLTNRDGLAVAYPVLTKQAWGLHRDTAKKGRVELAAAPGDLTVGTPYVGTFPGAPGAAEYVVVPLSVNKEGFHAGTTYILSASQAHLIGDGTNPEVAFPMGWQEGGKMYLFDGITNYATNVPGEQKIDLLLAFPNADLKGQGPKALMYKGLRIPLSAPSTNLADLPTGGGARVAYDTSAPTIPGNYLRLDSKLGPILNKNVVPPGVPITEGAITEADGVDLPLKTSGSISPSLRVDKLYQLPGTKIVKLDVSRGRSPVDIWEEPRRTAGEKAELVLVDADGNTFTPIGWLHGQPSTNLLNVRLDSRRGVPTVGSAPMLSSAGKDTLDLLFSIPVGRTIVAVKLGDLTLGTINLPID